jgi:hypothetical protein
VVFLYGSLIWGLLPFDYDVSWEGHLSGAVVGIVLAILYRDQGPERPKPSWELEEEFLKRAEELGLEPEEFARLIEEGKKERKKE